MALKLRTQDGEIVEIEPQIICRFSNTIKDMVGYCDTAAEDEIIPITAITKRSMDLIINWANHHVHDSPVEGAGDSAEPPRAENMTPWDKAFIDSITKHELFDLLLAANFLDIRELLDLGCKKAILSIKGKTTEEMREYLEVVDDLTPEMKEQIKRENEWCESHN